MFKIFPLKDRRRVTVLYIVNKTSMGKYEIELNCRYFSLTFYYHYSQIHTGPVYWVIGPLSLSVSVH
jgi:hypothetical protein